MHHYWVFTICSAMAMQGELQRRQGGRGRCMVDGINMCGYETHKQMIGRLRRIEQRNPSIAQVRS